MEQLFQLRSGRWVNLEQFKAEQEKLVDDKSPDEEVGKKKFCEFCDAKGPIKHLKTCTRPK